jgi:hypothetical protein
VWSHAGMICTGETYKNVVKMTFAKGSIVLNHDAPAVGTLRRQTALLTVW